jgi:2-polyprenyl-3-methyl-5-hydroxy-6-metoxy-1,4-benzoquinol methylase
MVGENHKVLDLGCNFGQLGKLLIEKGNEVHGIDISPKAVECSKSLGIMAKVGNLEETIDFENQSFDVVVAMEVIEHILDTDFLLYEIYRVLKTEGRLIITTPNMASLGKRILLLLGRNPYMESSYTYPNGAVGHIRFFTKDSLISFLKYKKFRVTKFKSSIINFSKNSRTASEILARIFPNLGSNLIIEATKII